VEAQNYKMEGKPKKNAPGGHGR